VIASPVVQLDPTLAFACPSQPLLIERCDDRWNPPYEPCSVCRRTIAEINLTGCTQCPHAPSPAAVERAQDAYRQQVDKARRRERDENAALRKNGDRPAPDTADPAD